MALNLDHGLLYLFIDWT